MTVRRRDWRSRLLAWAERQVGAPFRWGRTDCASLARRALRVCFGREVAPDIPTWHTAMQAHRVLQQYGTVREIMLKLGAEERSVAFARTGDVLVMTEPEEPVGAVTVGVWLDGAVLLSSAAGVHIVTRPLLPGNREILMYSLWEIPRRG